MQTFAIILAIVISTIALLLFALSKYRTYTFNRKSYPELLALLRESRKTYNRLSAQQRDSNYGRLLHRSIFAIDNRLKEMEIKSRDIHNLLLKNRRNVGNYKTNIDA